MSFVDHTLTPDRLARIQLDGLRWTVGHALAHSPFYRERLAAAGVEDARDIRRIADLANLPFVDHKALQEGYPFPLRCMPFEDLVRVHASSGTTGKRKVLCYTEQDLEDWRNMFARCYEVAGLTRDDRVQIAVGYGLWTAGVGFQAGCERFGALAVPVGPANAEMHCELLVDMQSTVFCATASMALLMAEEVERRGLRERIALKKVILGAERCSDTMRRRIGELLGVTHIHDIYGLTELYGPGTGLDCHLHQGIHYWADLFIFEIIDPETLQVLPPGREGELVVTTLRKQGSPLIRYRTHDITRLIDAPCPCGNPFPRHGRILGRTDDMFIYRAVNIYPSQIEHLLGQIAGIGSEFQIHLEQRENGRDKMRVLVERAPATAADRDPALAEEIATAVRRKILVRCEVEIVEPGSLPRTQRKSRRVFDHRNGEPGGA